MIHKRANELMMILADCTPSELDPIITLQFAALIDENQAIVLIKLRQIHDKHKDNNDTMYPTTMQIAVELALLELELETSHIQLDRSANDT